MSVCRGHTRIPLRVRSKLRNGALSPDPFGADACSECAFDEEKRPPRLARARLEDGKFPVTIARCRHRDEQFWLAPLSLCIDDADDDAFIFHGESDLVPARRTPEEGVEPGVGVVLPRWRMREPLRLAVEREQGGRRQDQA